MPKAAPSSSTESSRRRVRIAMVLVAAGLVFAVGGAIALVSTFLGRPGDRVDVTITPAMPIEVGDRLVMKVDEASCTVEILAVLEDGRLLLVPCGGDGAPVPTPRSSLRAPLYRRDAPEPRASEGDIVLVPRGAGHVRATLVTVEGDDVCLRPEPTPTAPCVRQSRIGLARVRSAR